MTPSGLNATSEGELRTFYAWIEAQQEALFIAPLSRLLNVIQLSLFGEIDADIGFSYVPL
ncbi:anti-CBASS protein Acb1 family protein [Caballeronia cordobensis]|uniref:anti-CBASS protein Acb1 family protein n=1 Tax=Caballeronia cordobensis TaxID=1353886 RepID=UPI0009FDDCBD